MATIRHARPEDASAIAAFWNPLIRDTAVTFNPLERPPAEIAAMIRTRTGNGLPWLVADAGGAGSADAGAVVGFAALAPFRPGPGYAHTMEHTIILDPAAAGQGLGARLMAALVAEARARGVRSLIAAISAENPAGIAFHTCQGFAEVGRIPEAGRKFDRWIDLVLMQRRL